MFFVNSLSNIVADDRIYTSGTSGYGIRVASGSNSNVITNETIITTGTTGHGLYFDTNNFNNTFSNMYIQANNTGNAIFIANTKHNFSITNSILNASIQDMYIGSSTTDGVWNFTNVTHSNGTEINYFWQGASKGLLIFNYYLNVYVYNTTSSLPNANVVIKDKTSTLFFSGLTDAGGNINTTTLPSFMMYNVSNINYYSPYSMNVTALGYEDYINNSINLTNNLQINALMYPTGGCIPILLNTSLIFNVSIGCMPNNTKNDSYYNIQYDSNYCGVIQNTTFTSYIYNESCDYCTPVLTNTSLIFNMTIECMPNNTKNDSYYKIQYDLNYCGEIGNTTFTSYIYNESCDYCTPNLTNTSLIFNVTIGCMPNNTKNDSYYNIQYDSNYCGEIGNMTFTSYIYNESCVYCIPFMTNTSWIFYQTIECMPNNISNDSYYRTQYDSNYCGSVANTTFYTNFYNASCVYISGLKLVFRNLQGTSINNEICDVFYLGGNEQCINEADYSNLLDINTYIRYENQSLKSYSNFGVFDIVSNPFLTVNSTSTNIYNSICLNGGCISNWNENNYVGGSGTVGTIPKWISNVSLGDSKITTTSDGNVTINGSLRTNKIMTTGAYDYFVYVGGNYTADNNLSNYITATDLTIPLDVGINFIDCYLNVQAINTTTGVQLRVNTSGSGTQRVVVKYFTSISSVTLVESTIPTSAVTAVASAGTQTSPTYISVYANKTTTGLFTVELKSSKNFGPTYILSGSYCRRNFIYG
jgi:hypothetical protein